MAITLTLAAAAAMALSPAAAANDTQANTVDAAFEELASGNNRAAIDKLEAEDVLASGEAARMINLGAAYERVGRIDDARRMFKAALASDDSVDLELADGSWVSSRSAARMALEGLERRAALAMR